MSLGAELARSILSPAPTAAAAAAALDLPSAAVGDLLEGGGGLTAEVVELLKRDDVISALFRDLGSRYPEVCGLGWGGWVGGRAWWGWVGGRGGSGAWGIWECSHDYE
jgi:hypothetical protein